MRWEERVWGGYIHIIVFTTVEKLRGSELDRTIEQLNNPCYVFALNILINHFVKA